MRLWSPSEDLSPIRLARFFVENNIEDGEVLEWLAHQALENEDPKADPKAGGHFFDENEMNYLGHAINCARGVAVDSLVFAFRFEKHKELILSTLEKAADDPVVSIRVLLAGQLGYVNNLDKERGLKLFLKLTERGEAPVLEAAFGSAKFMRFVHFEPLRPFYKTVLVQKIGLEKAGFQLAEAWIRDLPGSLELLEEAIAAGIEAVVGIANAAAVYQDFGSEDARTRSLDLFRRGFAGEHREAFGNALDSSLNRISEERIDVFLPALRLMFECGIWPKRPYGLIDFFKKSASKRPSECLKLLSLVLDWNKVEPLHQPEEIVNAVRTIYHVFDLKRNHDQATAALDLIDKLLLSAQFRYQTQKFLEQASS